MNIKNNVFFVIIALVFAGGITAAYALGTVTFSGDVNIEDGALGIGISDTGNDDVIKFDDGSKTLKWDNADRRFEFNSKLFAKDGLYVGTGSTDTKNFGYNIFGIGVALPSQFAISNQDDVYVTGDLETGHNIFAGRDIFVGTDEGTDNDSIHFDGAGNDEEFFWNEAEDRFVLTDDFELQGNLVCTDCFDSEAIADGAIGVAEFADGAEALGRGWSSGDPLPGDAHLHEQ